MTEEELYDEELEETDASSYLKNKISKEAEKMLIKAAESGGEDSKTKYIPTGNVGADLAFSDGQGLPKGASILLWAEPGCGKTTLIVDIALRLLKMHKKKKVPFKVLYLAVEGSRQLLYSMGAGPYIESKDFFYVEQPLTWQNVEVFYDAVLKGHPLYKDVKMIVIDSVQNVLSKANLEKSVQDGDFGTRSKERTNFYSKYLPLCKSLGVTNFLVSQVRQRQDAGLYDDKQKAAASWGDRHNVDIILKCSRRTSQDDKIEVKTVFGTYTDSNKFILTLSSKGQDCKNRYIPGNKSEILIEQGVGAHNEYALKKMLTSNKLLIQKGSWYLFNEQLCSALKIEAKNLRGTDVDQIIIDKEVEIIKFLKDAECYCIKPVLANKAKEEKAKAEKAK